MNNGVNEDILNTYSAQSFSYWLWTKHKQRGCELSRALILSPVKSSCLFGYNAWHPHKHSGANRRGHRFWIGSKLITFSPPPSYPWGNENNMKPPHTLQWVKAVRQPGKRICLCWHQSQGAANAASLIALHQGMCWHYVDGSVLTEGSNAFHASAVKPSLRSLSQHRGFRRNATENRPLPLSHRQHCSALWRTQRFLNAQRTQPLWVTGIADTVVVARGPLQRFPSNTGYQTQNQTSTEKQLGFPSLQGMAFVHPCSLLLHRHCILQQGAMLHWSPQAWF